jgi:hypothetical protein
VVIVIVIAMGGYFISTKTNQSEENNNQQQNQNKSQTNDGNRTIEVLLENYCFSEKGKLKLANYYYFNLEKQKDSLVVVCKDSYNDNVLLSVLKSDDLSEISKYTSTDLSNYSIEVFNISSVNFIPFAIRYPFIDVKIEDINNDNKNELAFYSEDCGGSNSGCTAMIYLLYPQDKELYHIFRYINNGPDEKTQIKNFYSANLESIENKKIKDYLINLMDDWFISMYGNKNGF